MASLIFEEHRRLACGADGLPACRSQWSAGSRQGVRPVAGKMPAGPTARMAVLRVPNSFHVREKNVGGHPGAESVLLVIEMDLYAEDLLDAVFHCLNIARSEFRLAIDLLDDAREIAIGIRIDADPHGVVQLDQAQPRLGHVNANPKS